MNFTFWGPLGSAPGGLFGRLGGLLGRLGAILGVLERSWAVLEASWAVWRPSWAVLEASWAILVAWVGFLGRHGSPGEPQGGAMAAQGPLVIGAVQLTIRRPEGGGP